MLHWLGISNADLVSTLPSELGNLTSLLVMFLLENQLFGSLPSCFAEIQTMQLFTSKGNNLNGVISCLQTGLAYGLSCFLACHRTCAPHARTWACCTMITCIIDTICSSCHNATFVQHQSHHLIVTFSRSDISSRHLVWPPVRSRAEVIALFVSSSRHYVGLITTTDPCQPQPAEPLEPPAHSVRHHRSNRRLPSCFTLRSI